MGNSWPTGRPGRAEQEGWGAFGDAECSRLRLNPAKLRLKVSSTLRRQIFSSAGKRQLTDVSVSMKRAEILLPANSNWRKKQRELQG